MEAFFVGNVPEGGDNCHGILVLILNILVSGLGTFLVGCAFTKQVNNQIMLWGLLQFICMIILVGWIWSIWWGVVYFIKRNKDGSVTEPVRLEEEQHLNQQ